MHGKIVVKPTAHKKICLLCDGELIKGDKCLRITQEGYMGGLIVDYVCKKHLTKETLGEKEEENVKRRPEIKSS